ncbi:MAG: NAD(P)H-hydrate dehydratase [Sedimentisphaerales bacterium]|nr:NAD(P)H-hydrate dehydratase [Sedimentisphaerales bacterium]
MANFIHHQLELPPRNRDAHKGDFGRILIIGGSRGMIGAPAFSANAAFASGAGLVRMALPATTQLTAAALAPGATSYPLADTPDGLIRDTSGDISVINALIAENDIVVFGPGLGHGPDGFLPLITTILAIKDKPVIIDADGLNCLSRVILAGQVSDKLSANFILTPHLGEMKRLWQAWFRQDMPAGRLKCAEKLARTSSAIVLLKGMESITTDGTISYQNETGNPGMAVGGSGDVLTGIIAGICGNKNSGLSLLESTALGAYIHGLAGDLAAADKGEISLTPQDIINFLPKAWQKFMSRENQPPAQK